HVSKAWVLRRNSCAPSAHEAAQRAQSLRHRDSRRRRAAIAAPEMPAIDIKARPPARKAHQRAFREPARRVGGLGHDAGEHFAVPGFRVLYIEHRMQIEIMARLRRYFE